MKKLLILLSVFVFVACGTSQSKPKIATLEPIISKEPTAFATDIPEPPESPTEIPTPSPTKESTKTIPYVTADKKVNLRSGPGKNYEIVGSLNAGEKLPVIGRNSDYTWWQVEAPVGAAWVAASVITVNNPDKGEIFVAKSPSTPTPADTLIPSSTFTPLPAIDTPVPTPIDTPVPAVNSPAVSGHPSGASAQCRDGTYSYSSHRRGTCSHHGGVAVWY